MSSTRAEQKPSPTGLDSETKGHHQPRCGGFLSPHWLTSHRRSFSSMPYRQQGSYLWAANGKESGFYPLPDRATILAQVANHRRSILAAKDLVADQRSPAPRLYEMLVKPAEHLIHHGDRVYIVGDEGLNGLNFETLLTPGESSHYWIEDVTITQLPSRAASWLWQTGTARRSACPAEARPSCSSSATLSTPASSTPLFRMQQRRFGSHGAFS